MDVAAALANITTVQNALRIVAMLQITADMWPPQPNVPNGSCYDVIVVGAGSAGAVVAARLAQHGLAVLLVEAGGDPPIEAVLPGLLNYIPRSAEDWNYTANCDGACYKNCTIPLTRGKMLGGSSGANFMFHIRGNPQDYHEWSQIVQDPSWEWDQLLKYFKKSEDLQDRKVLQSMNKIYHGTHGQLGLTREPNKNNYKYLQAFKEMGHNVVLDVNGYDTLGYVEPMLAIAQGVRQSTAYAFLHKDRVPPNLHVLRNTLVTKVIFDAHNRAVGIEAQRSNGQSLSVYASRKVILSAGVLNTPQLLMLSGIGPESHLKSFSIPVLANLPVGFNLQDHIGTLLPFKTVKLPTQQSPPPEPSKFPTPVFLGFVSLNKTKLRPDYQSQNLVISGSSIIQFCSSTFNIEDDICQEMYNSAEGREVLFTIFVVLHPESRGRVTLKSTDPTDPPIVNLGYYSETSDLDKMASSIEDFINISNSSFFQSVDAELIDVKPSCCTNITRGTREYWRCYAKCLAVTQLHYVGTAPLGTVLDSRLHVRGVHRLMVADASAIPLLPSGNTNAPVIMIGEKAADVVIEDLLHDFTYSCEVNVDMNYNNCDDTFNK